MRITMEHLNPVTNRMQTTIVYADTIEDEPYLYCGHPTVFTKKIALDGKVSYIQGKDIIAID